MRSKLLVLALLALTDRPPTSAQYEVRLATATLRLVPHGDVLAASFVEADEPALVGPTAWITVREDHVDVYADADAPPAFTRALRDTCITSRAARSPCVRRAGETAGAR